MVQVCGEAVYVDDMKMHNMLHAALVYSSRPHAKILSVDASAAIRASDLVHHCMLTGPASLHRSCLVWLLIGQQVWVQPDVSVDKCACVTGQAKPRAFICAASWWRMIMLCLVVMLAVF